MVKNRFTVLFLGIAIGAVVSACASVFPYKYYSLDAESFFGSLRGPEPKDDLSLMLCKPTENDKAPCMVLFTKDLLSLKLEFLNLQNELEACRRGM